MKRLRLQEQSVDDLVERFAESCLRQFKAELESSIPKQNRCVEEQMAIADELKTRPRRSTQGLDQALRSSQCASPSQRGQTELGCCS